MKPLIYYAHSAQDELGNLLPYDTGKPCKPSVNVGEMAAEFAQVFGAQEQACQTGKLHDLGKYLTADCMVAHQSIMLPLERKLQKTLALEWRLKYKLLLSHFG